MSESDCSNHSEVIDSRNPSSAIKTVNETSNKNQLKAMVQLQSKKLEEDKKDHQSYLAIKKSGDHLHVNVSFKVHQL